MKRSRRAFSLVELLMVTLIIGAWAGSVAGAYGTRRGVAEHQSCAETRLNLAGAMEAYNLAHSAHRSDLAQLLPELVREGYLTHLPADPGASGSETWRHFSFDGRDVVCALHRGPGSGEEARAGWPALALPLVMLVWAMWRFATSMRRTRVVRVRVDVPVIDPMSGPIGSGPASAHSADPVVLAERAVAPACHFCHAPVDDERPVDEDGFKFHAECAEFYREKLRSPD